MPYAGKVIPETLGANLIFTNQIAFYKVRECLLFIKPLQ